MSPIVNMDPAVMPKTSRTFQTFYEGSEQKFSVDDWATPGTPARRAYDERMPTEAIVNFVERESDGTLVIAWAYHALADSDDMMATVKTYVFIKLDGDSREFLSYPHPEYL